MELTVQCQKRAPKSKNNALRREGKLPAVLYGHNGTESIALTLDAKTASTIVKKASINNTLIQLNVTDVPWKGSTLLREVQTHPWRGDVYHLSFFAVAGHGDLQVTVPLHFVGEAVGVKTDRGALDTVLNELEVECAPENIPEAIEIDVSDMKIGDAIHVHELVLPKGVTALGEPDRVVVSVLAPTVGEETTEETSPEVAEALAAMGEDSSESES
ncbi:50S ribosomal protein L25/general stress protein Ctc [Oculatella sp. LEGE 06141]|uniref:50S ribosomal protein L25/general stress protein Ctc n=1 Tax=Oculatella sp. LEGE 06141 TaxID=1828648 RepID=UPI001880C799|nr:50S ribosomal protein L25/general stress protein Ctc [Oculatella sp. LEGE 06141]MBE9181290.1 50S ribosomal protein L25/general stress protein Ctc [Oculatella sp. LEGE 06141]